LWIALDANSHNHAPAFELSEDRPNFFEGHCYFSLLKKRSSAAFATAP
jgi:hypothetical protein